MMIWQDKKCRSVLKVFYVKLYVHSLVESLKWPYTLIGQFIPQSARIKEDILMGNLEGKMDLGDISVDGSKITY